MDGGVKYTMTPNTIHNCTVRILTNLNTFKTTATYSESFQLQQSHQQITHNTHKSS
jgi:hypothetical protein